jgi:hypothetical protein
MLPYSKRGIAKHEKLWYRVNGACQHRNGVPASPEGCPWLRVSPPRCPRRAQTQSMSFFRGFPLGPQPFVHPDLVSMVVGHKWNGSSQPKLKLLSMAVPP